jgi:putative Mn2+ efflux pump MntP
MSFSSLVVLATGLAMDAAAVAAARGLAAQQLRPRHFVLVGLFFGGFQALMPLLGWQLGRHMGRVVAAWDHWIAFGLLGAIGLKMIHEAVSGDAEQKVEQSDAELFGLRVLAVLAVATSLDAFAIGVTLPILNAPFVLSLVTIGVTTALLSALALAIGRRFGTAVGRRFDAFGGIVLLVLGTKVLIEHLRAG